MFWLGIVLCLSPVVQGATTAFDWCYHNASCNDATWAVQAPQFCNGSRQSPIDIVSASAALDTKLTNFTFTKFDSKSVFTKILNTGRTVKVAFGSGVQVSGGGLNGSYDSLQFHLHWGDGSSVPGSEHTVDGKRYPMELHIVSIKSQYNGNITQAVEDSSGAAALGFFIDVDTQRSGQPAAWKTLAGYLSDITLQNQYVNMSAGISLDDLLSSVNRTRYYRYMGSLTTPLCYEAVVWTVFKEPVRVSKDVIDMFSNTVRIGTSNTSVFMSNVFRNLQAAQPVTHSAASNAHFSYALFILIVALWMR